MLVYIPPPFTTAASFVPSELEAIELQAVVVFCGNPEVCSTHVDPELMLVYIPPRSATAASFVPSALEAIEVHFADDGADVLTQPVPTVAVALLPNPDLSFHDVIDVPLAAGTPVAFGSEASSHRVHPDAAKRGGVNGEGDGIEVLAPIVAAAVTEYVVPATPSNVVDVPCTVKEYEEID
jgi:hypothetical protein